MTELLRWRLFQPHMRRPKQQSVDRLFRNSRLLLLLAVMVVVWTTKMSQAIPQVAEVEAISVKLIRRQAATGAGSRFIPADRNTCASSIYCQPTAGANITGSTIFVAWNGAQFKGRGGVTVQLLSAEVLSAEDHNQLLVNRTTSATDDSQQMEIPTKDVFKNDKIDPGKSLTRYVRFQIGPIGNVASSPVGPNFQVTMSGPPLPPPPSANATSTTDNKAAENENDKSGLSTPVTIAVGVASALAVAIIAALLLVLWAKRRKNTATAGKKGSDPQKPTTATAAAAAGSTAGQKARVGGSATGSSISLRAQPAPGENTASDAAAPGKLSTGDAALIAAMYRQELRKPSWKDGTADDDDDDDEGELPYDTSSAVPGPTIRVDDTPGDLDAEDSGLLLPLAPDSPTKSSTR